MATNGNKHDTTTIFRVLKGCQKRWKQKTRTQQAAEVGRHILSGNVNHTYTHTQPTIEGEVRCIVFVYI